MVYGAYLRKSRTDISMEKNNPIDTLRRHKDIIMRLAKNRNIQIDTWYQEVVSAETIEKRPEVQKMLLEVEKGVFEGIFVIDIDRLARGDTADQARIFQAFAYSSTKIITPNKVYDPNNEADEEFFEFGLFMSRREYKLINKRLNRGRISSVNEGKFVASVCPYGYTKEKIKGDKGYVLVPIEEEAKIVRLIFSKACDNVGSQRIANFLNTMKVRPRKAGAWSYSTIRDILCNPTYYGMIKWNYRRTEKKLINGIIYKSRPKHKDYILVKGLHEPLISKEVFGMANRLKRKVSPRKNNGLQNPLAGLLKCYFCNQTLQRKSYKLSSQDFLICPRAHCKNCGSFLSVIEDRVVSSLLDYFLTYPVVLFDYTYFTHDHDDLLKMINDKILAIESQLHKIYDLLEQNIYDAVTFYERKSFLLGEIEQLKNERKKYEKARVIERPSFIPKIEAILEDYYSLSIEDRNKLLKSIINKIYYKKIKKGKNHEDQFTLKIILNI